MPKILSTVNVNGIRAAAPKGLLAWLAVTEADIICLQETRATDEQTYSVLAPALDAGWFLSHAEPGIKGRAGVAILSRREPDAVRIGVGAFEGETWTPVTEFAELGRYIEADFDELTVASVYVHTGEADTPMQDEKYRFLDAIGTRMTSIDRDFVISGDWNIGHTELDIKNWKGNVKNSGFLPQERAWISSMLAAGYSDVVRELNPGVPGPYSWHSYRGRAFDNDAGWRIDYQLARGEIATRAKQAVVERAATYAERWSDHAPVTVQYR
ncbi:exodeoxyribonuclease III [Nocardia sp. NBC_01503]|uniref:exodeoxyribonuclease III n=1 Tax=Nocardia sp. NBC_01503 TaxID=2975997 RepID=UPI002E7AC879|nr:exodeoxyribonuclease III [Nocardia sp. NBC_01503]WTL33785.1 exodeoxyribonuclease III [Nocardia sp. NBC_01503]